MVDAPEMRAHERRVIVKLRPGRSLRAAEARAALRPLTEDPATLRVSDRPAWYVADLPDGGGPSPWDLAHARVADQLGLHAGDVLFAEPDLVHDVYPDPTAPVARDGGPDAPGTPLAVGEDCRPVKQNRSGGRPVGPEPLWHLGDDHSQLAAARDAVTFREPRTRIAHLDTGYQPSHATTPRHVRRDLERSFVPADADRGSARDPNRDVFLLDAFGHGTGTLSLLAGQGTTGPDGNASDDLGGAPDAEVVPLRIADRVVLLYTSAFAEALAYADRAGCDVLAMSMGGLPSRVWRETVDDAYLHGLCMVTAAGNNFAGLPTRHVVYPARYGRVIAACGVMADGRPYDQLHGLTMQGNHGPASVMTSALAACTPNVPWAAFGCPELARHDGQGTSAATPQIAAAAALWLERYKDVLPRDWRRVEAVRHALFASARPDHPDRLGRGGLRAADALAVRPRLDLPQTRSDPDSFAFLRVLTGLGLDRTDPRETMFDLEIAQRWLLDPRLQALVPDPHAAATVASATLREAMEILIEDDAVSSALRRQLTARYPSVTGGPVPVPTPAERSTSDGTGPLHDARPELRDPAHRRLRTYAVDPSLSTRLDTASVNETLGHVRWEPLAPGPVGEYLAVEDVDASGTTYDPVDLDDPRLLAQNGWAPSEGNPQFHQQMVYAVAMTTIEAFESALGRPVLWRPAPDENGNDAFVRRLKLRPHALRQANAFYSPERVAVDFGYFDASDDDPGHQMPGSRVYACLSRGIVAHEVTHAVLDGIYQRFTEPSNIDVLALHEAFADIVALMQHLSIRDVLTREIARTRGDIESESMLGSLAVQFGRASGRGSPLRDAIGTIEDGVWRRRVPDPTALERRTAPHARGAILVAAVFDAFIAIYQTRTADLFRIASDGTGVLGDAALHPDLVDRLVDEATKSARHVQTMCIRALDYLPPVDVTFFEYLRALITADADLVRDDTYDYRVAFVEAFRRHGIYPLDLRTPTATTPRTLSVDGLRWRGLDDARLSQEDRATVGPVQQEFADRLKRYADDVLYVQDRERLFDLTGAQRNELHAMLKRAFERAPTFATTFGLDPDHPFEVADLRHALRVRPDGRPSPKVIVGLTQEVAQAADADDGTPEHRFHGGATVVVDLSAPAIQYAIVKNVTSRRRRRRTARFFRELHADPLRALFLAPGLREPFALLHALTDD